jgi:hypothetical protein
MSLWTPSGEHPVGGTHSPATAGGPGAGNDRPGAEDPDAPDATDVDALRRQLAEAPADVVVANHCYGLFELAAVYLSTAPANLEGARLAIDALGFVVDGLGERLGEAYPSLRDALAQIRLAYVQIAAAEEQGGTQAPAPGNGSDPLT